MGFARTKNVLESKGKSVHVSNGWWECFKKRHPHLAIRTAEKLSYARSVASDPSNIARYFD